MAKTREVARDSRDYDTTQLREAGHGRSLHRDYSAHFFRWSFARRFINAKHDILEIGCGEDKPLSKILTGGVAARVNRYVGVDLNKLKPSNSQRLDFRGEFDFVKDHGRVQKDYPDGFDVIVHFEVIEHMRVELGTKMLKACYKLLKPGGTMLMSTPCYDGFRHAANHIHEYTVPELEKAVTKAGFKVDKRFGTFMDIKHLRSVASIGSAAPDLGASIAACSSVLEVKKSLSEYYDNDAISCIFAPLFPDAARNNLWVCSK